MEVIYIYIYNNNNNNNNNKIKNELILSSFLCDFDVKVLSQKHALDHGISWGYLINKAIFEYLNTHSEDSKGYVWTGEQSKPLTCQVGDCRKAAVAVGTLLVSGKEYRLCASHANLYKTDKEVNKLWKVKT